ncbi:hypothetical protein SARC_11404 [Sphaeroforma arctica JP610]|uniref:Uncharacterized protein n=1 Tax=Sphaeroforma arctica JP610 TaxID=667725 RepID=A0A0L0FJA5_9EUKA|nr:hypothetical protein SARC_11404 [Sphaeroforma arctica JP610]KNC76083.1 hypothetical protein SARC_11404 [Sphaeroforma arctica JP610]|eukprot:XP_014149985.1 hypothetical protein SARC_11404 [Sphaeroforma arctica JP610]
MAVCSDEGYVRVWSTSDRGSAPVTSHRAGYEASGGDVVVGGSGYDSNGNVKYDIRDKMSARQKYSEKDWKARTRSENSAKRRSKQLDSPRSLSCGGSPGSDNVFIRTDTGKATHVLAECDALNAAKLRDDSIVYAIASGNLARRMYWKKDKSSCTCAAPTQQGISIPINMPTHTRKIVVPSDTPLACSKLHVSVAGRISERSECKRGKPIESRPHTSTRTSAVSTQTDNGQPAECVSTQVRHHVTGGQNANACQEGTVAHTPTPKQCRGDSQVDRRRISKSLTPTVTTPAHADTTETAAKMSGISGTKKTRSTLKASGATLHQLAEGSTIEMRVESGKEVWERTRVHINAIPFRKSKANRDIRSFFQPLQSAACKPQAASTVGDENKPPSNGTKLIARTRKGARLSVSKHNCTGKAADDERKRITPLAASTRLNSGSCTKTASIAKLNGKSKIAATKGPENRGGDIQTHLPTHTRPVLAVPRQKAGRKLGDTDDSYVSSCKRMKTSGNEAVDTQQTMNPVDAWFYPVQ